MNDFRDSLLGEFGEARLRACPGFSDKNGRLNFWSAYSGHDGYVVPYREERGAVTGLQLRLLDGGYVHASGARNNLIYCVAGWSRSGEDLFVTEGGTKAYVAAYLGGVPCFGVAGQSLAPEHVGAIARLQPRRAIVSLDREANSSTELARQRWLRTVWDAGLPTYAAVWEGSNVGGPKGLDDLFLAGGQPRVRRAYFVPPETGERRRVRSTTEKGAVSTGMSLAEARRLTRSAIKEFVGGVGR